MPADQASRNPQDVPVFHAMGQRPRGARERLRRASGIVAQHVEGDEAGFGAQQLRGVISVALGFRWQVRMGCMHALIGQHRIEAGQFFHGDFAATQRQRQPVVRFGLHAADARALQELIEIRLSELSGHPDRRNVAAANESVLARGWGRRNCHRSSPA
jgi:hypothetical protein